ncbi:recombinase family protein [Rhodococcus sp. G-MC3]|uniref:recombinase family protein n=1 Tax=Rhodococcus sp. G-MC3 TaxID=3046209 RepID=UPI0024B9C62A|nr:recombinase family protein [Rhodococcus sp. G-MC3]MDJ0393693.1 recombinase family protein [Rhodococcus sp. G-MC3]
MLRISLSRASSRGRPGLLGLTSSLGYATVRILSVPEESSTARRNEGLSLAAYPVRRPDRVYTDHGVSGRQAKRPGLENAINASREGDEFCVTKLDRLSRSAGDLHETVERLATRVVAQSIDGNIYDPTGPKGKKFIGMLGLMAEYESDLIRARTRGGRLGARQEELCMPGS